HYGVKQGEDDVLFQIDGSHYRRYRPGQDPAPIVGRPVATGGAPVSNVRAAGEHSDKTSAKRSPARTIADRAAQPEVASECLQAVHTYEQAQSKLKGSTFRATRTGQMIARYGIIPAAERAVNRSSRTMGYQTLVDMGLAEFAFEQVVLRHPDSFSQAAVSRSRERVAQADSHKPWRGQTERCSSYRPHDGVGADFTAACGAASSSPTLAGQILDVVSEHPGQSDREIADRLRSPGSP